MKNTRSRSHRHKPQAKDVESFESAFELLKALCETFPDTYLWKLPGYRGVFYATPTGLMENPSQLQNRALLEIVGKTASKESGRLYLKLRQLPNFHPAQQLVPCRNCPTPCISDDKMIPTAIICPIVNTSQ